MMLGVIDKIRLTKPIKVHCIHIRTKDGKRVEENKVLKAGEYDVLDKYVIESELSIFEGFKAYKITDGKFVYALLQHEIERTS